MLRVATTPVLIPGVPDSDGDVVSVEQVQKAAHGYMNSRMVDIEHTLNPAGATVVESYLTPSDLVFKGLDGSDVALPAGTWMMSLKFNEATWRDVQRGTYKGVSVMAVRDQSAPAALKSKRTTLADLGDSWIVPYVSLVGSPAVPGAVFLSLKSGNAPAPRNTGRDAFGRARRG